MKIGDTKFKIRAQPPRPKLLQPFLTPKQNHEAITQEKTKPFPHTHDCFFLMDTEFEMVLRSKSINEYASLAPFLGFCS